MRSIQQEFDFKAESVSWETPLPREEGLKQIGYLCSGVHLTLTHRGTGQIEETFIKNTSMLNLEVLQTVTRNLILLKFRGTETAKEFLRRLNRIPVTLLDSNDLSDRIGEGFHVALRKHAQGPGSAVWWHLIREMPSKLYVILCEATAFSLREKAKEVEALNKPLYLSSCIEVAKSTWEAVLEVGCLYFDVARRDDVIDSIQEEYPKLLSSADWPKRGSLTLDQAELLQASSQKAYISLGVLSQDDWACMLCSVTKDVE